MSATISPAPRVSPAVVRRLCLRLIGIALLLLLGACATTPPQCASKACANDQTITEAVKSEFEDHTELRPPNQISIQVLDGVVYLTGIVDTDRERSIAESVAGGVSNVVSVVNSIVVSNSMH